MLRQVLAITQLGLRSIPERLGPSLVIVIGLAGVVVCEVLIDHSLARRGQFAQGREKAPSWLPIAAMSSNAHCSLILPSSLIR